MKQTIKLCLLATVALLTAFVIPSNAQDVTKDMAAFAKKFQAAYNKHDDKALKMMYTADAVRIATDGTTLNGNEAISADFAKSFTDIKPTIEITPDKTESQSDGSAISTGTYHVTGRNAAGESIDLKGSYTNTVVKEKGQWKLAKSVLTAM